MAPILKDITNALTSPVRNLPSQIKKKINSVNQAALGAVDSVSNNISKLNNLGKQLKVSDEFFKAWQSNPQDSLAVGAFDVPHPDEYQSPVKRVESHRDSTPNHGSHSARKGSSCLDSYNCHAYAVGKPVKNGRESSYLKTFQVAPDPKSHPSWNHYPANELRKNYFQLRSGRPTQVGDVVLYGIDHNKNGKIDDLYRAPNGQMVPEINHSAVVVGVKNGKPTLCHSKRGSEPGITEHGPDVYQGLGEEYGYRLGTFRLKPGVNPERRYK